MSAAAAAPAHDSKPPEDSKPAHDSIRAPDSKPARGHNRITHTAIRKTVESVTAQAFRVGMGDVSATLADDTGKLGVSVSVKLAPPPLLKPGKRAGTVFEQAQRAREEIVAHGQAITGLDIGRVDIRLSGGQSDQAGKRRVR